MYRDSALRRGRDQSSSLPPVPLINNTKSHLLAKHTAIHIHERLQMLQILLGYKWLGEASMEVLDHEPSEPNQLQQDTLTLLKELGIAAKFCAVKHDDYHQSWIHFATNDAILYMFLDAEDGLSSLERGVLYGYTSADILAFLGMISRIERTGPPDDVALFYLGGTLSREYEEQSHTIYSTRWEHMKAVAPDLIQEATNVFERMQKNKFSELPIINPEDTNSHQMKSKIV